MRFGLPILLLLAGAVYVPSLGNGFTLDDRQVAMAVRDGGEPDAMVGTLQPLARYFTTPYWQGSDRFDPLYRPVTILSYALVYQSIGRHLAPPREALPQHALNVLLHALCVWLAWRLLRPFGAGWPALMGAAAFGLAAIHSEVVATVAGRAELLGFAGGASGLLLVAAGLERAGWRRWTSFAGAGFALFLAMGAKENAITWAAVWPIWVLALDRTRGDAPSIRRASTPLLLAVLPVLAFLVLRDVALDPRPADLPVAWIMNPIRGAPLGERLLTATMLWPHGLWKTLWPVPLAADYGASVFEPVRSPLDARFLLALVALAALVLGGLAAARRRPLLALAPAIALGCSLPTANLLLPIGTLFAERLWFTPSLGLACAVAWLAQAAPSGSLRRLLLAAGLVWGALNAVVAWQRCAVWSDNETLFLHDAEVQPRSMFLRWNAAIAAHRQGDRATRDRHLTEAVAIEPGFARGWHDLGCLQLDRGELGPAEATFGRGLASPFADRTDRFLLHTHLGVTLALAGRPAEARAQLEAALRLDPEQLATRWPDLSRRVGGKLDGEDVVAMLHLGKQLLPGDARWDCYLGCHLARLGRLDEARPLLAATLASAAELVRRGRPGEARTLLAILATEPAVPAEVRARALELGGRRGF